MPSTLAVLAAENEEPLAEAIFRSLLAQIYDGRLAAGALLNEAALAEEYRTSRGPVREAIRRLQGLQARHPRAVPARARRRAHAGFRAPALRDAHGARRDGMQPRRAAHFAGGTRPHRARARGIPRCDRSFRARRVRARRCSTSTRASPEPAATNASPSRFAATSITCFASIASGRAPCPSGAGQAYQEHWQILRALKARDGQLAESLMRAHIGRASDVLLKAG